MLYKIFLDPFVQMASAPDLLVQTLWEGLVSGVLYALIALGFVLIFKACLLYTSDPNDVAICIGERLLRYSANDELAANVARLKTAQRALSETVDVAQRIPYFCSGCPHNSSTVVPEGMHAYAGIGCHFMAQFMDRSTLGYTQMGGEGANWIGEAPFSSRDHVFQNLGDGTYNHSGYLAIRAAIASGVKMTYKILFNDAVAMTGGQANEGGLNVPQIARQRCV